MLYVLLSSDPVSCVCACSLLRFSLCTIYIYFSLFLLYDAMGAAHLSIEKKFYFSCKYFSFPLGLFLSLFFLRLLFFVVMRLIERWKKNGFFLDDLR